MVTADAASRNITASLPVPGEWPEQQVRLVDEEKSPQVKKIAYKPLPGGTARQMIVTIPGLKAGEEARAIVTFEVTRSALVRPEDTSGYSIPKPVPSALKAFLAPSPFIESTDRAIKTLAAEAGADLQGWEKVEALYTAAREKLRYEFAVERRSLLSSLEAGHGDCEELSSLFVALCRASGVPARIVWVPGHAYAEFYLADAQGEGHWFPCQPAGEGHVFGEIVEYRPILQKGDSFKDPEQPAKRAPYVKPFLIAAPGSQLRVQFLPDLTRSADAASESE